ncbi:MAG: exodeoxyribonuclease VII large subunit [Planctomycetota bacterium]|jgi:exodeoxyribonuclease VII large subunit|nr:exodeoxyribonuclease VII large subunit [Planctomycetota bacterium]
MRRRLAYSEAATPEGDDSKAGATLSVSELTRRIKNLLETSLGTLSVVGEISGLKASPSGHVYFSLKDREALIDAVVWRSAAQRIKTFPRDGEKVTVRGKLAVYEPRGRYQLIVTSFETAGKGDLWQMFEALKEKLASEGLFDPARKKPLPANPAVLGIVTSPGAAALRDILKIVRRRSPGLKTVIAPCRVQGQEAAEEVARAINSLERWGGADIILVSRGGGSMEDLWTFNTETVARAIAAAVTPVVSAVGHQTDFTIADFVADVRAATPSEAAEMIAPDQEGMLLVLARGVTSLRRALTGLLREKRLELAGLTQAAVFRKPLEMFMPHWQRLDDVFSRYAENSRRRLEGASNRLELARLRLQGLSPYGVLSRGYAVVTDPAGHSLTEAGKLKAGDQLKVVLYQGRLGVEVKKVEPSPAPLKPTKS